jgi:hypothetical protein
MLVARTRQAGATMIAIHLRAPRTVAFVDAVAAELEEQWTCADYQGKFMLADGRYCYALTIPTSLAALGVNSFRRAG